MKLVAIDPGTEQAGFALFDEGVLVRAELVVEKGSTKEQRAWKVANKLGDLLEKDSTLVIEHPQVYARGPGDPDDLLALALVVGGVLTLNGGGEIVRPAQWKGQVPKKIMSNRILKALTEEERLLTEKVRNNHNVLDAIGVGLWKLKRFK
jgi:hypothetical protein